MHCMSEAKNDKSGAAWVIHHADLGVYLGTWAAAGFHHWSAEPSAPAAIDFAPCFEDLQQVQQLLSEWKQSIGFLAKIRPVQVLPDVASDSEPPKRYASVRACMAAGLPGWISSEECLPVMVGFGHEELAGETASERLRHRAH